MFDAARIRLTAWYLAILAACLTALGAGVYVVVRSQLADEVDQGILEMADRARFDVVAGYDADLRAISTDGPYEVFLWDGGVYGQRSGRRLELPHFPGLIAADQEGSDLRTIDTDLGSVRIFSQPVRDGPSTLGYLQVARSVEPEEAALEKLLRVLLLGGGATLVLAGLGGWFLAGKALRPVRAAFERQQSFVGDASHELRTPLAVIRANAEYLQSEQPANVEVAEIVGETDRLATLVDALLAVARGDRTELGSDREPVDLGELTRRSAESMKPLADQRHVRLAVDAADGVVVRGDDDQLRQVVVILVDNALRYTHEGGAVEVAVARQNGRAELAVRDTGIGIPEHDLPRVFDRFYRADTARTRDSGGVGLGLAIARELVGAHGGTIDAESEPGRGSTFTVRLPAADA